MGQTKITLDGNEAVARIAYKTNDVIAIYPITPSSPMGELADDWYTKGEKNIWGGVPRVIEMQSEGGAAGTVHGALLGGSLTTTFTSSQGLLLMIPDMYKTAGELRPNVIHVAARSLATHSLSIFCDHSDVMAARSTGYAMLFSSNVQESMDMALIAQAATLKSRIPFMNIFDGFRTSHEVCNVSDINDDLIHKMIPQDAVKELHDRALTPDKPKIHGTAQNPDTFFQNRERVNPYYEQLPSILQSTMDDFAWHTGIKYNLYEYFGSKKADRVIVAMGSAADVIAETVSSLISNEKVGVVKVRLFRPFSMKDFLLALPSTVKCIAVLDRTKEPGAIGEPLYQDVVNAFSEYFFQDLAVEQATAHLMGNPVYFEQYPRIIGGRYGLSSKEFSPAMVEAIFREMDRDIPRKHFTVGINDDVSHLSIPYSEEETIHEDDCKLRGMFYGLASDGTVSANKNSIKIIGDHTDMFAQGYFEYDSKKAGTRTLSHVRIGERPILAHYSIQSANFVACHNFKFLFQTDVLERAEKGATFLLNTHYGPGEIFDHLPPMVKRHIQNKDLNFYVIDANKIAQETGMGRRVNTILQVAFFALADILPIDNAVNYVKEAIQKTYSHKGDEIIQKNYNAVDQTLQHLHKVEVPADKVAANGNGSHLHTVPEGAPDFVRNTVQSILQGKGDDIPVSQMPVDGGFPTGTAQWEKRSIAEKIPVWNPETCTQCNKCVLICPHSAIRAKVYDKEHLDEAPEGFLHAKPIGKKFDPEKEAYTLQVSPDDCTSCDLCVEVCPVNHIDKKEDALYMSKEAMEDTTERDRWNHFVSLPEIDTTRLNKTTVKDSQLARPLFEFSGACPGCGETPYLKLISQLFGDRLLIANATGCSSIYCGNLPTTPWTKNQEGRGPAWANSLFEDNAEFALGLRVSIDNKAERARELLQSMADQVGSNLANTILENDQSSDEKIEEQRKHIQQLKEKLDQTEDERAEKLKGLAEYLCHKSVWAVGGDGWAYDIGYGGLDHVLASGENINVLVMDTEVYSNTGGQTSKATPIGAKAKFAGFGKGTSKKQLGLMALNHEHVYVAQIAMGANDAHSIRAISEAEAYPGPSLIIAYSHCIEHGYDMAKGAEQQSKAVKSGHWPLFTYDPRKEEGKRFKLNSSQPSIPLKDYMYEEARFFSLLKDDQQRAETLLQKAQEEVEKKWEKLKGLEGSM